MPTFLRTEVFHKLYGMLPPHLSYTFTSKVAYISILKPQEPPQLCTELRDKFVWPWLHLCTTDALCFSNSTDART